MTLVKGLVKDLFEDLLAKFPTNACDAICTFCTNASGATWWQNFELIYVAPPSDQIFNLCEWHYLVAKYLTNSTTMRYWILVFHQLYNYEILDSSHISHQIYNYEILDSCQIYHQLYNYEILDSGQIS